MRRVITLQDVPDSGELKVPIGTLVTPSARDLAGSRGVKIAGASGRPVTGAGAAGENDRDRRGPWRISV